MIQGELEHRKPKGRYKRTSRKKYIAQLTQIERRQERIRRMRTKIYGAARGEDVAKTPEAHHHIGESENFPERIGTFLSTNDNDPALKVMERSHARGH